jgi:hypothetical protein
MSEGYLIGPDFLGRIRRVVDGAESAIIRMEPTRVQTRFEGDIAPPVKTLRLCTFEGEWEKGAEKECKIRGSTVTFTVTNLLYNVVPDSSQTSPIAVVGKDGTGWYFVNHERGCDGSRMPAADLDSQNISQSSNVDNLSEGDGVQVLLNEQGCSRWFKTKQLEVVVDVKFDASGLSMTKKKVWILNDSEPEADYTITLTSDCENY